MERLLLSRNRQEYSVTSGGGGGRMGGPQKSHRRMYPSPLFGSYSDDLYFVQGFRPVLQSMCLLLRVGNREDLVQEEMLSPLQLIRSVPKWRPSSTPDQSLWVPGGV